MTRADLPTCEEPGREARLLHGIVRDELEAQGVALGCDDRRQSRAAVKAVLPDLARAHL